MATEPTPADNEITIRDPAVMRALAHPARLTILEHLRLGATATATECAEVVGLSPSATSYHLRALARVGLIEQAPSRGDARERVWRSVVGGYQVEGGSDDDPEVREAMRDLINTIVVWEEAQLRRYMASIEDEPKLWQDHAVMRMTKLMLTADELAEVGAAINRLLDPYRLRARTDHPAGARPVSAMIRIFPVAPPEG